MYKSIVLAAAFAAVEAGSFSPLLRRQLVELTCAESGEKDCGDLCIPLDYTCCPSGDGGCPTATSVCQLGDNGEYGCCPLGETCGGDGGANTLPGGIIVSTETIPSVIVDPTFSYTDTVTASVTVYPTFSYTDTVTPSVTVTATPSFTYTDTVTGTPYKPTNGTGVQPPSPSVSLFPGAADRTTFSAVNFLAVLLPFLFA